MTRLCFLMLLVCGWLVPVEADDILGVTESKPQAGRFVKVDSGFMVAYDQKIPGTERSIRMEPIPGKPAANGEEKVEPFWMSRCEQTHGDLLPYLQCYHAFKRFENLETRVVSQDNLVDAVTAPTPIYAPDFSFEFGKDADQPIATVTMFAARQYTKWLSLTTELQFRLPTEHEWEHAARAGSSTRYYFGDDAGVLGQHAWFEANQKVPGYRAVGSKRPNAWGLYDMHGNMAEWVLQPGVVKMDQQILKGGCWESKAEDCCIDSVMKYKSRAFREFDPNLPQSPWWLASYKARWVGFRIIRPFSRQTKQELKFAWEPLNRNERLDVQDSLAGGRGVRGLVDRNLPKVMRKAREKQ